ncbi:hypothetical protein [Natrinema salaciae]|uniref:Uncharacterized protein n=1 Tax=Natrinema salaciae TaxID=1186196 RepID=A0A1H9I978_9EURY|nr:hypothetical protein [Natrinema salaciae]SEQ71102.1 hypothetical protein SAMN04489841_2151 [Natrinema salaciae]
MADTRSERVEEWRDHVDELCHDGETVEHRADLEGATVVVTNQRVMAFTPDAAGPNFRHVDRPNVGTVTVETTHRLGRLCAGFVVAFVGVGLLEFATDVSFATLVPGVDRDGSGPIPEPNAATRVVETAIEALETTLLVLEWGVLAAGVAALAVAALLAISYLRSRSRRLVLRVTGGDDLPLPVGSADLETGAVSDLERAIRPGTGSGSASTLEDRTAGEELRPGAEESG